MMLRSLRRPLLGVGLVAAALGVTLADGVEKASFKGTWRSTDGAKSTLARAVFTPTGEGSVAVAGELRLDGDDKPFTTNAAVEGDVCTLDAVISRPGLLAKIGSALGVASKETVTMHARLLLDRSAGRMEATWRTSKGVAGTTILTQFGSGWEEKPLGGSDDAEKAAIADLVKRIQAQQDEVAKGKEVQRGFHNKGFGVRAELRVASDIAADLQVGVFQPGTKWPAIARFSNAGSNSTSDFSLDQRGLAFRIKTGKVQPLLSGENADAQDFLTTNSPITTRDPVQFLDTARALTIDKSELLELKKKYGVGEALYAIAHLAKGTGTSSSHTEEKLWSSRAPLKWGRIAVKVALTPASVPPRAISDGSGIAGFFKGIGDRFDFKDKLHEDMKLRLMNGDIVFDMWIQRFDSEQTTPIEDGSIEWKTPLEKVGQLVFTRDDDLDDQDSQALAAEIEKMAFNPWNCTEDFRPLGSLMRARKDVYKASAGKRGACPFGFLHR